MRKFLMSTAALLAMTVATNAADINLDTRPFVATPANGLSVKPYVGGAFSYSSFYESYSANVYGGFEINRYFALELNYDLTQDRANSYNSTVSGMAWARLPNSTPITPMIGAGIGYRWTENVVAGDEAVWTLGAGLEYSLTQNISLNTRYRYVEGFDSRTSDNQVTVGLSFRF